MKKIVLLLSVFIIFFSISLQAQFTITVADGTETNSHIPLYGLYMDEFQHQQVIYPASMLTDLVGTSITSLTFYLSNMPSSNWTSTFNVSLGPASAEVFSSAAYLSTEGLTQVYSGNLTIAEGNKLEIQFVDPYTYTGGNLLLDISTLNSGNYSSANFYGITSSYSSIYGYHYSSVQNIYDPYYQSFIPKTSFTVIDSCATFMLSVSEVTGSSAFISWQPNPSGAEHHYELSYKLSGTSTWTDCPGIITDNYKMLTGLLPDTTYEVRLRTWCGGGYSNDLTTTFTTECSGGGNSQSATFGSGTGTSHGNRFPTNMYYYYSYTQQLFLASEINGPKSISQIDVQYFYSTSYTRNIDIYLGHTSKSSFSNSSDWVSADNLTLVWSGNITFSSSGGSWFPIYFTTPFQYNGTDNLVVVFDDNTGSYNNSSEKFYTHTCSESMSLSYSSDSYNTSPMSPNSGTRSYQRMNMRLPSNCISEGCDRPNVVAYNVTDSSALLIFAPGTGSTDYEIQYCLDGGEYTTIPVTTSPYLLTGLMQNTKYSVRIRSHCSSGWSAWKNILFTTTPRICSRLYVKANGSGDGTSWASATSDLAWALRTAELIKTISDTAPDIWVAEGVYQSDISTTSSIASSAFYMVDGVNVYGGFAGNEPDNYDLSLRDFNAHPTILDGQHVQRVLEQATSFYTETVWDGFTLRNGSSSNKGGGAFLRYNTVMRNCRFVGNTSADNGGGVYIYSSSITNPIRFEHCEFIGNSAYSGGGLHCDNYAVAYHCVFSHNQAQTSGGGVYIYSAIYSGATLSNCLVTNNTAKSGGGIYSYTSATIVENTTIANNAATENAGGLYAYHMKQLTNCIVWGNRLNGAISNIEMYRDDSPACLFLHNAVEGGIAGEGNIPLLPATCLDGGFLPHFANPSTTAGHTDSTDNVDWHLLQGSVCVNRGSDSLITTVLSTDLDGGQRVRHGQVDMGCYESDYEASPVITPGDIVYVTQTGSGSRDGSSWANAMDNLETALAIASMNGSDIWVAEGTYYGDTTAQQAFTMMDGVDVYGGFAGNESPDFDLSLRDFSAHPSVLDGQNSRLVVSQPYYFANRTIWDGLTIQNGHYYTSGGGMILVANITLENCLITHNYSEYSGGGIYAYRNSFSVTDSIKIIHCTITENTATQQGGGIYAIAGSIRHCDINHNTARYSNGSGVSASNSYFANCTITHNHSDNNFSNGGGIYQQNCILSNCLVANNSTHANGAGIYSSSGRISNCDVVNNEIIGSSGSGAGIYFADQYTPTQVTNTIVWGNRNNNVAESFTGAGFETSYSAFEGGCAGEGNICLLPESYNDGKNYPYFANPSATVGATDTTPNTDWRLTNGSPCINRGSNTAAIESLDLDGAPRIRHNTVDMGCYESDFDSLVTLPLYGNIIYVTENGTGDNTGRDWNNATSSIHNALDLAYTYGADVWVAQGTYYGDGVSDNAFIMKPNVNVYGGFAGDEPEDYDLTLRDFDAHPSILDGQNMQRVLFQPNHFTSATAVVWDGFTIQHGGVTNQGAGVILRQYSTLIHCIIQNNTIYSNHNTSNSSGYGAGVYANSNLNNSQITTFITNCIIRNNAFENNTHITGYGAGLYAYCVKVSNTEIGHNSFAYQGGGASIHALSEFRNCLIHHNMASSVGSGVYINSQTTFINCDIVSNSGNGTGAGIYRYGGSLTLTNCIIWGNKRNYLPNNTYGSGTYTYCAVEDGYSGTGNITLAATNDGTDASQYYVRFLDPDNGDFQIHPSSACVNIGNNDAMTDSLDLYGHARIYQNAIDIGCSESTESSDCPSVVSLTADNITTNSARLVWHPTGNETQWALIYGLSGETTTTVITNDTIYNLTGLTFNRNYTAKVRAICENDLMSVFSIPVNFQTSCDPTTLDTLDNFSGMTPADSSTIYNQTVAFGWSSLQQATSYDLYVWRDGSEMPAIPSISGLTQANVTMNLPNYARGNVYHWKVVAWNECISKSSPVQEFRANPYPDLHVSAVEYSNPVATQQMTVTWTVTNDGEGNTPPGVTWNDYIWISPVDGIGDGFWYNVSEKLLATVPNLSSLNAGESYQNTVTVTVPEGFMGNYYLFVLTDQRSVRDINYSPTGQLNAPDPYTPSADGNPYHYLSGTIFHHSNKVEEHPEHEADNFFYKVISVMPPPSPDLVVSSVVHSGDAISGNSTNVTWTVTNQGEATAVGPWMDAVYLSQDTLLDTEEDIRLGRFIYEGGLPVGDSYQHTEQVTIPVEYMGDYYFIVVTDNTNTVHEGLGEQNNRGISQPITVTLTWLTDLMVSATDMPVTVDPNGNCTCHFTVTNQGSSPTYTNFWKDAIYISTDAVFDPVTAIKVGTINHSGVLNADATYDVQWNVHIPETLTGAFHWFVVVDVQNNVFEYNADDNNVYMYPQITAVQLPDLEVTNIEIPETVNPNENVILRWTVRNNGPGNIVGRSFTDQFLYDGEVFHTVTASNINLAVGDYIVRTANLKLPCGSGNAAQLAIQTDCRQSVSEGNESNNTLTVPVTAIAPDLTISNLVCPTGEAWSGTAAEVSYTITNSGGTGTSNVQVTDKFYLSTFADSYQESDLIGSYTHALNLAPQSSANFYHTVSLPNGISGTYYYHVVCNADTTVCENGSTANNVANSQAVSVNLSPSPDLVITQIAVPSQTYVGADFELAYTLKNQGNAALHNANVIQKFYFSPSSSNYDTNQLLATIQDNVSLGVNESMTLVASVSLPFNTQPMRYYIHGVTDVEDAVYEHNAEGNNTNVSGALIANIYQLDLQLTEIDGPEEVQWGETVTFRLHVVNNTELATLKTVWQDVLYLSSDQALQSSDPLLSMQSHNTRLDGNADYWVEMPVTIPYGAPATAYLFGITDINNANPDINPSNNVFMKAITVNSVPTPDLAVEEVTVLNDVYSGQTARIAYKVTNVSETSFDGGSWMDKLFLSSNGTYESGDLQLQSKSRNLPAMAQGDFYRDTLDFTIPLPYNGSLYLLLMVNASNNPFELERANNTAAANVNVILPPPGDLVVRDVTCESAIVSGQVLHASWNVRNIGDNSLFGNGLKTLVYISSDTTFDANDRLLGNVTDTVNMSVDQSVQQSLTAKISGVRPGDYYLIVKTDVTNAFNESDDNNNAGHSAMPFTVSLRLLPFNTDVADTLSNSEVSDFMIDVGENVGQTVRIHLSSADSLTGAVNMIYTTHNDIGDNLNYTYSTIGQFSANPEMYIPATQSGFYGVSLYGSSPLATPQNVVIRADILPFELHGVNADHGGNTGEVTVELTGSRFRPGMNVTLRNNDEEIIADSLIYVNYYQSFATFDLTGRTPGVYDVSVFSNCEGEAVLQNGFTIESGVPSGLSYNLIFPSSPRPNRSVVMMLEFGNVGNLDLHDQVLEITSIGGSPISLTPEGINQHNTVLQVPLSIEGEPEGLLRPGSYGTINIYGFTSGSLIFTIKPVEE